MQPRLREIFLCREKPLLQHEHTLAAEFLIYPSNCKNVFHESCAKRAGMSLAAFIPRSTALTYPMLDSLYSATLQSLRVSLNPRFPQDVCTLQFRKLTMNQG
ncbi:isocitrate dehydrogenase subunit 1 [Coccidioides immitis RMSCC 3703]|uniref:Isocitrate dehydrogenase subunit 1 n=1 Tax=Coccidioides immitis RMSCC 3703 TaxID=454286 RepID=A0A0J8RAH4_COCIT|nr:isocitrate dehydrogenase subunit 1 [Coccidioides immitis RMSCC 3703]